MTAPTVWPDDLQDWTARILAAAGVSDEQARSVAEALAQADARGIHTHGVEMLPRYVRGFQDGLLNPRPDVRRVGGKPALAVWDGDNGLGHHACDVVTRSLVAPAREFGVAAASLGNSNHFGMAARFCEQLAERSLIGFVTTNTPPVMPAFGGRDVVIGNNPVAWAVPRRDGDPIVLDMAVSAVARGKIRLAASAGERIPLGWATDAEGRDTTDPDAALAGHLLPAAGAKGYGLAVVSEILAAALPAAKVLTEISTRTIVVGDAHDAWGIGHFILAVDPAATGPLERFHERVERVAELLTAGDGVMLPGEPELTRQRVASVAGIALPAGSTRAVEELASRFGIAPVEPRATAASSGETPPRTLNREDGS